MKNRITEQQFNLAMEMRTSGITWDIICTILKIDDKALRQLRKEKEDESINQAT
tara:strand:+ start:187 stop:348 length:162 start_codon:yes stop_codon:yes gene_type:complete